MQQPQSANQLQPHPQGFFRPYLGGSLPNVNQIAANPHMGLYAPVSCENISRKKILTC